MIQKTYQADYTKDYHAREESVAGKRSSSISPKVSKAGTCCHLAPSANCIFLRGAYMGKIIIIIISNIIIIIN